MMHGSIPKAILRVALCGALIAPSAYANLSIQDYLSQVKKENQGYQATQSVSQGSLSRSVEADLLTSPVGFLNATSSDDQRETVAPLFQGSETRARLYSLGISQQTNFGLQAKLSYNLNSTTLVGVNPATVNPASFYEVRPSLELSQPLWRNGFGRELRANRELLRSQALALSHGQAFQGQLILAEAEITFWRLAAAREVVRVQEESLQRFQKLKDWSERRSKLQLADKADYLQSLAALEARKLELQAAQDELLAASRAFNTMRGKSADVVEETLERMTPQMILGLPMPIREGLREDVRAAQEQQKAAEAGAFIGKERNLPSFDVFANLSLNGRDGDLGKAAPEAFTTKNPWTVFGVRFSTPLQLGSLSDARSGYEAERMGAELNLQRRLFEQEREWTDLSQKFQESRRRLELAASVENSQKDRLLAEKDRLSRGRTTTFQVLLSEQDYANAQLGHLRAQTDVLGLIARMKTFKGVFQ